MPLLPHVPLRDREQAKEKGLAKEGCIICPRACVGSALTGAGLPLTGAGLRPSANHCRRRIDIRRSPKRTRKRATCVSDMSGSSADVRAVTWAACERLLLVLEELAAFAARSRIVRTSCNTPTPYRFPKVLCPIACDTPRGLTKTNLRAMVARYRDAAAVGERSAAVRCGREAHR